MNRKRLWACVVKVCSCAPRPNLNPFPCSIAQDIRKAPKPSDEGPVEAAQYEPYQGMPLVPSPRGPRKAAPGSGGYGAISPANDEEAQVSHHITSHAPAAQLFLRAVP
jgi:hypothetical protein